MDVDLSLALCRHWDDHVQSGGDCKEEQSCLLGVGEDGMRAELWLMRCGHWSRLGLQAPLQLLSRPLALCILEIRLVTFLLTESVRIAVSTGQRMIIIESSG